MNISIYFTNQCNLECKYCYEENKKTNTNMTKETLDNVLKFIESELHNSETQNIVQVKIHGGEPLLNYKTVLYMINKAKEVPAIVDNIRYEMTTNLTILNDEIIDLISYIDRLYVSIDGDKVSHDRNRVFKNNYGSYDIVKKNILSLLNYRPDLIGRVTISKNTKDRLINNVLEIYNMGIKEIVCELNFREEWTYKDLLEIYNLNVELKEIINKRNITDLYYANIESPLRLNKNSKCGGGVNEFSINYNGDVYPCIFSVGFDQYKLGNLNYSATRIQKMDERYYSSNLELSCHECSHFQICDANRCFLINEIMTGKTNRPWPFFCVRQNLNNLLYSIGATN